MFRTGLTFDLRAPDFGAPRAEIFSEAFEMMAYADAQGFDQLLFSEHHSTDDGYVPVPALTAAGAATRTKRIALVIGAIVLPLHDPVAVAETIAVTDHMCAGRLHVALVAGYAYGEFRMFGKSMHDRAKLMDHGLSIITRALAGERFKDGDREICVRPLPYNKPPHLYVGGGVAASARRAAKFGLGFWTMKDEAIPVYEAECRKLGRAPGAVLRTPVGVHCAEDPDRGWSEIGPHVLHYMRSYAEMAGEDPSNSNSPMHGLTTMEAVRTAGVVRVLTPDECVALARTESITMQPLMAGLSPKLGWKCLELFATRALPRIKAEAAKSKQ
jgi:alkanesulfonate monooxygenase SsuD/methylene tetrahydromethanopterin reductase-like flavin-dependent oxidoreductase (luciferase family)